MGRFFSVGSYVLAFFCALAIIGAAGSSDASGIVIFTFVTALLTWMGRNAKRLFSNELEDQQNL